ncbi:molybdopterin cofactor-binding domain-containing protein [Rhizobium sp. PAMB 3182]
MSDVRDIPKSAWFASDDMLLITGTDGSDIYIAIDGNGAVTAFNGHVDLGTGIRTALAQIVAEELDLAFARVDMVLGSTGSVPDQGATIASETIQIAAKPLRFAAATARRYLLGEAAERLEIAPEALVFDDGIIREKDGNRSISFGEIVTGRHVDIPLDRDAPVKPVSDYRLVGTPQRRSDIPAKSRGAWIYVHDVRLPGMLHGRVVRPPYAGYDQGPHVGNSLIAIDEGSVADIPGMVGVFSEGDFVGLVTEREEQAIEAMNRLKVDWKEPPARPDLNDPYDPLHQNPGIARKLADKGNVDRVLEGAAEPLTRSYVWPYQMHASIGPSCAVADWREDGLTVWSGTQNPFWMRRDLAQLLHVPESFITVERLEAAGCYGRNCADDVTADAALLSRACGRPVRVQLTREQEHEWEPKGTAQVMDVRGALDLEGGPAAYDFESRYPSNASPTLALILTGRLAPVADTLQMGDRTAIPPYDFGALRVTVHDMPPIARASWFRGVSSMPNTYAHESFIDELAAAAKVDPIEYRLRYMKDERAIDLIKATAERAGWTPRTSWGTMGGEGDLLYGRGFAYAVYVHGTFPGVAAAWAAWVTDVAVNRKTGEIAVTKVICGQDSGLMINPDGVKHQIHGNIVQSVSRTLKEQVEFDETKVVSKDWGSYPLITFPDVPDIDVLLMPRQNEPPLGVGESASVPSAAAICNAVYDATGIRFRELPLTPEKVLAALNGGEPPAKPQPEKPARKGLLAGLSFAGIAATLAGLSWVTPFPASIAPVARPQSGVYSTETLERGRLVAAAGACNVCHVGADGTAFAGGRAFETPFGNIYAPNITPDPDAGIGAWSYPAFARAMREGVSRNGHFLYPAHPYTSLAGVEENDMQALYAYMNSLAPSRNKTPQTALAFPFNIRTLMAGWNALFHKPEPFTANTAMSAEWNRGAYLVETLGHCSACHTERNVLQAEKTGTHHLAGGFADGWEAPALTGATKAPSGWTTDELYAYLRHGYSENHGGAGGPMAEVVASLAPLPNSDIRAMATYLTSLKNVTGHAADPQTAIAASDAAAEAAALAEPRGKRIFDGACASCHENNDLLTPLALRSAVVSDNPANVLQVIVNGAEAPARLAALTGGAHEEIMSMPAFGRTLTDKQIGELARYVRARFAPGAPAWNGIEKALQEIRH